MKPELFSALTLASTPGLGEILVICAVILLLFGADAIPKFARGVGRAKREFERGLHEGEAEEDKAKPAVTADAAGPKPSTDKKE